MYRQHTPHHHNQQGFTLIELLVVIGILGVLMAITLIAINPVLQFQNVRNVSRQSDVSAILDAIYQYQASNSGVAPPTLANVVSTGAKPIAALANQTATSTSFASPNLTLSGLSGNIIALTSPVASVTIASCSQAADNGTYTVVSGTATTLVVNNAAASGVSATGCVISAWTYRINPCTDLVPTYIAALPMDPTGSSGTQCATTYNTGYTITISATGNRYTIAAPSAENGATISITR